MIMVHVILAGMAVLLAAATAALAEALEVAPRPVTDYRGLQKVRDSLIGDVYMVRGISFNLRRTIGKTPNESVPPGVYYDLQQDPD